MIDSASRFDSKPTLSSYSRNDRKQILVMGRKDGNKAQLFKTSFLVRACLFTSLVATILHEVAVHHRFALLSDDMVSLKQEAESASYEPPIIVPEQRLSGSTPKVGLVTSNASSQKTNLFVPAPPEYAKLAYFDRSISHKLYEPVIRAFHSRGWSITNDEERAHVFWFDQPDELMSYHQSIKPWQRINQLPHTDLWDDKDSMAQYINRYYEEKRKEPLHSFPESYAIHDPSDFKRFQERLLRRGGLDIPWVIKQPTVNQGKVRP
jgi:hypothetical protein